MFFEEEETQYELLRKQFHRIWLFAHQVSRSARRYQKEGKEEEFRAAMTAFRTLSKEAKEVRLLMASFEEPRPAIIDTDVAVEEDMRLTTPELFLPREAGGMLPDEETEEFR